MTKTSTLKWNSNNSILRFYEKKTDHKVFEWYDRNFDFNFEKLHEYRNDKGPISISYDLNEDGFFETIDYFDFKNNYVGKTTDANGDQVYEYYEIILESGDTLSLTDQNANGVFELKR